MNQKRIYYRKKNKSIIIEGRQKDKPIYLLTLPKNPEKLIELMPLPPKKAQKIQEKITCLDVKKKKTKKQQEKHKKEYVREYLKRDHVKEKRKEINIILQKKRKEFLEEYKKEKSCNNCNWNEHPEILQFHHIKNNKEKNISKIRTVNSLKKEIAKCILLCPNCHFLIHYKKTHT